MGGYLLKKLCDRPESKYLQDESGSRESSLIGVKNRGRLITPKLDLLPIVYELEAIFRAQPSVDRQSFLELVCQNDVHSSFFDLVYPVESTTDSKESFYVAMCNLFFIVRAHQKCRHMLDVHVRATKGMRKSKALRDSV